MPAFCQCGFYSEALGLCVNVNVIVPQSSNSNIGVAQLQTTRKLFPVIYLLHGLSDDHTIWSRRTAIELYAAQYECIIVMPSGGRSFYRNMASGAKYKDFMTVDLPNFIESTFPADTDRRSRYIAGLSMGGYGALAIGMEYPERYSKIAAFSSVADVVNFADNYLKAQEKESIFGKGKIADTTDDLFYLSKETVKSTDRPELFLACGDEDFLYEANKKFRQHLDDIKYPYTYIEAPGVHNWYFWDEQIKNALKFFCS